MDEAELCDTLGFIYQGRLIAAGSPREIKSERFTGAVLELEAGDLHAAAEALAGWPAVEEVVRVGPRLRLLVGSREVDGPAVTAYLGAHGVAVAAVRAVEPSVEDLFVSFVDKERKTRIRDQLRALVT
jgi:drug efflux transport system ATP-binding protein